MSGILQALLATKDVDPQIANVILLLHGEGANNSTTIVDSSLSARTLTAVGDAKISTTRQKAGLASIAFDGSGDRIPVPASTDFDLGSSDFTIEGFVRPRSNTGDFQSIIARQASGATTADYSFYIRYSNTGWNAAIYSGTTGFICNYATPPALDDTAWSYFAFCREGATLRLYIDGVQRNTANISTNAANTLTSVISLGTRGYDTGHPMSAYLDELRFTKGVCRYPGGTTFTVPTTPFPDP